MRQNTDNENKLEIIIILTSYPFQQAVPLTCLCFTFFVNAQCVWFCLLTRLSIYINEPEMNIIG